MKIRFIILTIVSVLAAFTLSAQNASQDFASFETLSRNGADKSTLYRALSSAYQSNMNQLSQSPGGSAAYNEARVNLLKMWPFLENAAFYYSQNHQQGEAIDMAKAYLMMPKMPQFSNDMFNYSANRAQLAYFVASKYFNGHQYAESVPFLQEYVMTGESKNLNNVLKCLVKACIETNQIQQAMDAIDQALVLMPNDWNLISMAINACIEAKDDRGLQKYLNKAIALKPNDPAVLNIQGKLYEESMQFDKASSVYETILRSNPNSLEANKHLALNYFNEGALASNAAVSTTEKNKKKQLEDQARSRFQKAIPVLEKVVATDPTSSKYNIALAVAYSQTDRTDQLSAQNQKLSSMGIRQVSKSDLPQVMAFASNSSAAYSGGSSVGGSSTAYSGGSSAYPAAGGSTSYAAGSSSAYAGAGSSAGSYNAGMASTPSTSSQTPTFSEYAKNFIENEIRVWQNKDPYETASEYRARVTEEARAQKVNELKKKAEADYIATFGKEISIRNLSLRPYDAENEVFLIDSDMGQLVLPVPRANNEARIFEQNWNGVSVTEPKYYIGNDRLMIAQCQFVTPTGKNYQYSSDAALTYTETNVDVSFDAIDYSDLASNDNHSSAGARIVNQQLNVGKSDVDQDIPVNDSNNTNTFALIISNENYGMVAPVPMANNDGTVFAEYCQKTLGIPSSNIMHYKDASYGMMLAGIRRLQDISDAFRNEDFNIIFYYAGHGIPDEATKDGYLLPVDASGRELQVCYSLNNLYKELEKMNASSVIVFLDACFSGSKREDGMLASARGIALKAKPEEPKGKMVVFSAATGDETAYPYKDKNHGLFTYFLLKKLKESKGKASLNEIADYLTDNVRKQSVITNHKSQTPTVSATPALGDSWKKWQLR